MLVAAAVIAFAIWQYRSDQKRIQALAGLAALGKWQFSRDEDYGIGRLCDFEIFNQGEGRYAINTITGPVTYGAYPCAIDMGDFSYVTKTSDGHGGTSKTRHYFSYLVVRLPFRMTPEVRIRREGLLDDLVHALGFEDINFESAEFSRKYCVKSKDRRFAYDLLHPRAIEFFLQIDPPGLIEIAAGRLCVTDGIRRWDVEEFRKLMNWAHNFVALWPEHLAEQLPERTA